MDRAFEFGLQSLSGGQFYWPTELILPYLKSTEFPPFHLAFTAQDTAWPEAKPCLARDNAPEFIFQNDLPEI